MNSFLSARMFAFLLTLTTLFAFPPLSLAQSQRGATNSGVDTRIHVGGRYHTASPVLPFLPYDNGDISATIGVEWKDASGILQLLINGMNNPGDDESTVNRILTPQINLLHRDGHFLAGVGALRSYIDDDDDEANSSWTRFYYQLILGLEFKLSPRLDLSGSAIYPFRSWNKVPDFKFRDMEYSAGLTFRF